MVGDTTGIIEAGTITITGTAGTGVTTTVGITTAGITPGTIVGIRTIMVVSTDTTASECRAT